MSYQVLARKWRPRQFSEVAGQEHVLRALINALDSGRLHHAFLFTGTRGIGKTTLARILAKSLNCEKGVGSTPCGQCASCEEIDAGRYVDLIEVDAASRTKVEDTRELLDNVQYAPSRGRYKVYLIDEVHMLSGHSFNALLKTLEEPPPHVKFLLATTDPQKLPVTILSRCLQFNLRRLMPDLIQSRLAQILDAEQIEYEPAALILLARAADGSMRDALSLLDQAIAFGGGRVQEADARSMLGTIEQGHVLSVLEALCSGEAQDVISVLDQIGETIPDISELITELASTLHYVALLQQVPQAYQPVMGDEQRLKALAQALAPEEVQLFYDIALRGRRDLPVAPDPRVAVEMTLLRMLAFRPVDEDVKGALASSPASAARAQPAPSAGAASNTPATPASSPAAPAEAAAPMPAPGGGNEWQDLVAQLNLNGIVKQLAMNASLERKDGDQWYFSVAASAENLVSKERQQQLQEALQAHLGNPVRVHMEIGTPQDETPAQRQARLEAERQAAAREAIDSDPNVQAIVDTFGTKINPNSIQPLDD